AHCQPRCPCPSSPPPGPGHRPKSPLSQIPGLAPAFLREMNRCSSEFLTPLSPERAGRLLLSSLSRAQPLLGKKRRHQPPTIQQGVQGRSKEGPSAEGICRPF
ncbi:mCG146106, partial [Mus musculus]